MVVPPGNHPAAPRDWTRGVLFQYVARCETRGRPTSARRAYTSERRTAISAVVASDSCIMRVDGVPLPAALPKRIGQGNLPTRRGSDQSVSTGLPYDLTAAIALEVLVFKRGGRRHRYPDRPDRVVRRRQLDAGLGYPVAQLRTTAHQVDALAPLRGSIHLKGHCRLGLVAGVAVTDHRRRIASPLPHCCHKVDIFAHGPTERLHGARCRAWCIRGRRNGLPAGDVRRYVPHLLGDETSLRREGLQRLPKGFARGAGAGPGDLVDSPFRREDGPKPAPASVDRAYHKTWGWVKKNAPTATSWGWGKVEGIGEKTRCKLAYQFRGSLVNNDMRKVRVQLPPKPGR